MKTITIPEQNQMEEWIEALPLGVKMFCDGDLQLRHNLRTDARDIWTDVRELERFLQVYHPDFYYGEGVL